MRGAGIAVATIALGCGLAGCSQTASVRADGTDTFITSGRSSNSVSGLLIAQNDALEAAREFCAGRQQRFASVQDQPAVSGGDATYFVRFRCLAADDPRVQRPAVKQAPDEVF
jgi:hypothetical protein